MILKGLFANLMLKPFTSHLVHNKLAYKPIRYFFCAVFVINFLGTKFNGVQMICTDISQSEILSPETIYFHMENALLAVGLFILEFCVVY